MVERILTVQEEQTLYKSDDGKLFARKDIFIKLSVTFRDEMLAKLCGPKLSVFICVALHCNRDMVAWPSITTIVRETGCSHGAVCAALKELKEMGLVTAESSTRDNGGTANNVYTITGFASMGATPVQQMDTPHPPGGCPPVHQVDTKKNHIKKNIEISNEISAEQPSRQAEKPTSRSGETNPIEDIMPKQEWKTRRWELANLFSELTKLPAPQGNYPELNKRWWTPLQDVVVAAGDMDNAREVVEKAINHHIEKHLALVTPQSIRQTAISFAGELKRNGTQSVGGWKQG